MGGWGMGWGGWVAMGLLLLLLVAGLVALALYLGRASGASPRTGPGTSPRQGGPERETAERILDERYARGEVDEQEYLHRRAVLRGER